MVRWIPWLFVVGLGLSGLGLAASVARFAEEGSPTGRVVFLALAVAYFGWAVVLWLAPRRRDPRIVPYFARQLEEYGGTSSKAFRRGRGLYRYIGALDRLSRAQRTRALSEFGFADDYYEQVVRWHEASEGLASVDAVQRGLDAELRANVEVTQDLEALATVLRVAEGKGVRFSLALRLGKDALQVVSSQEPRQGRFW